MIRTEQRDCLECGEPFQASLSELKRGNAKFCSLKCSAIHQGKNKPPKTPNCHCAWCQKPFYKQPSKFATSRSGLYFCCRAHKDAAQRLGGIEEIMPAHYGTSSVTNSDTYRRIAFEVHGERCANCGYDRYPILHVHHMDGNHNNAEPANLRVLCPTCHEEEHYLSETGRWTKVRQVGIEPTTSRLSAECSNR